MKNMTDECLVALFANGNNDAFDCLLERHQKKMMWYIGYNNIPNREQQEDIFQETFIKAIISIKNGGYNENGKFAAWLFRIAHNQIIDVQRKEKNTNYVSNDSLVYDLLNTPLLCDATIEDRCVQEQIHLDLRKLLNTLPESQREVLELRFYKDLSFAEIADLTNVSVNTALGRVRYAVMNIRKLVAKHNISLTA